MADYTFEGLVASARPYKHELLFQPVFGIISMAWHNKNWLKFTQYLQCDMALAKITSIDSTCKLILTWSHETYRGYHTVVRRFEVYLRVKPFFHDKKNFVSSNQRVVSLYYIDMRSLSKIKKKDEKQRNDVSDIFTSGALVSRISSFVWKIEVVYFSVKHSYLCNKTYYQPWAAVSV